MQTSSKAIILADGAFPEHDIPLGYLRNARRIICCDGGADQLVKAGFIPDAIVGDLDSITDSIKEEFADRLYPDTDQETNDLTKAVKWCIERDYRDIVILGATGKREDHTIGNISLLVEYSKTAEVMMITDTGIFRPLTSSCKIPSFPGQQISVFSINPFTFITSRGLLYPLSGRKLGNWWQGTLNEATGETVDLEFEGGPIIIFLKFPDTLPL